MNDGTDSHYREGPEHEEGRLLQVLTQRDVVALGFGAMIGFSWVVLAGSWVADAGALGSIAAVLIGGLMVVFVGLTYAELVSAMPRAGGEHNYAWRALGTSGGFVTSWALLLGYITVVAFEAISLSTAVDYAVPQIETGFLWAAAGGDVYLGWALVGAVAGVFVTVLNYLGIRPAAIFQFLIVMLLAAIGLMMLFGSATGGEASNFTPLFSGFGGLMAATLTLPFAFVGFDVIPQSAEEMNVPHRRIGVLLVVSVVLATLWYVACVLGIGLGLSQTEVGNSELATADAMGALFGGELFANILIFGGVFGILTTWNAFVIGASRLMFAMAESGMMPAWFGRLHPRYRTPSNAIIFLGAVAVVAPFFGPEVLTWMVNAGSMSIVVAWLMVAVSFIALRRKEPEMQRPYRAGRGLTVGVIAVLLSLFFAVQYLPGMPAGLLWPYEWAIVIVWWILGLAILFRMNVPEYSPER